MQNKGKYVDASTFNDLTKNSETVVIDMRNHYEYEVGHFENAIEIPSDTFREQLPMAVEMMKGNEEKNIIMYCTGGIRCEKASAYMLHNGFKNVFHLEGGIINYAQQVKEKNHPSKFIGKNFVFDDRLGEKLQKILLQNAINAANLATHIPIAQTMVVIFYLFNAMNAKKNMMVAAAWNVKKPFICLERQKQIRKGIDKGRNVFNKSRQRLRPRLERGDL